MRVCIKTRELDHKLCNPDLSAVKPVYYDMHWETAELDKMLNKTM